MLRMLARNEKTEQRVDGTYIMGIRGCGYTNLAFTPLLPYLAYEKV